MQLTLAHTLLLLPALTSATSLSNRDFTDSVKGFFGDPASLVRDLSQCMVLCIGNGLAELDCTGKQGNMDCACGTTTTPNTPNNTTTNTDPVPAAAAPGQAWEDATKSCFTKLTTDPSKMDEEVLALGCGEKDYEAGKALDICKAVGDKPDKKGETFEALEEREWDLLGVIMRNEDDVEGKKKAGAGGNGTADGQTSGAAAGAGAAGQGGMVGMTGVALAVVVGYAVAML
jgi:hypothetical protein